jgi:choline dehydrogenase-like flavoprotein
MFIGFADERDWSAYSFVIVGSGFAGQFLAEKLSRSGRVLLLEAGGRDDPLALGEGYYEIESRGARTPALGTRLSAFGGTANHWTGQSHPFSPTIFVDRPGIPGWPIVYEDYAVHVPEAADWLGLAPFYPPGATSSLERGLFANHADVNVLQFLSPKKLPVLGDAATQKRYAEDAAIDVLTDTRLVDIALDTAGQRVASVELAHAGGRRTTIPVRALIVCAGGIENARLMLWAGRRYPAGNPLLGGPKELTGKYYTEHPVYFPADIYFDGRTDLSDAVNSETDSRRGFSMWVPSDALLARYRFPRFGIVFHTLWQVANDDPEVAGLDPEFLAANPVLIAGRPSFKFEQTPHERGSITLADALDRDGVPRALVNWEILPADLDSYRRATGLMCDLLAQKGFARARLRPEYRQDDWSGIEPARSAHHMGATRMGRTPETGVVDRQCRVFGLDNMYVAGSSVFPNGDYLNPTLNFLALAARLAHFLQARVLSGHANFHFGVDRQENRYLVSGWSHPEDRGLWSDGPEAVLRLPRRSASQITLYGHAYRKVEAVVSVNGVECYAGPAKQLMRMTLPLGEGADVELVFRFPDLRSPMDFGESDDRRLLGFFIERVELR